MLNSLKTELTAPKAKASEFSAGNRCPEVHTHRHEALAAKGAPDPTEDHGDSEAEGQPHSRPRPQAPRAALCEGPLPAKQALCPWTACSLLQSCPSEDRLGVLLCPLQ